jgi:AcrR family transcriptional regulator
MGLYSRIARSYGVTMDQPRHRILDALLSVAAHRGFDAVSVRTVAAAAEVSPAQVQYYFRTKQQLLVAAYERVHERMLGRLVAVPPTGPAGDRLGRYLLAWLPLDADRRADATAWLAFTAAAVTSPTLDQLVRETDAGVLAALTEVVADGQADGSLRPGLDPAATAGLVLAVLDGLSVRALSHPRPEELVPLLEEFLQGLRPATAGQW